MTTQRVIKGVFYAHGGQVFAFMDTNQPYGIPGCAQLMRLAKARSNAQVGALEVRLVEDERFADMQAFAILTDKRDANRGVFERAVTSLFPGCKLETKWITNFRQEDGQLFWALLARSILRSL